jgi:hypothetical protein
LRDNNNPTIMPAPRRRASHPDCRCLPILIAALHGEVSPETLQRVIELLR